MSDVSDSAHVRIMLADYATADPATSKATIVGGGIVWVPPGQAPGYTVPFSVLAIVTFDPAYIGESPAVELLLEDQSGQPVALPGLSGPQGQQPQYLRVGISEQLRPTIVQGLRIPTEAVRPRMNIMMNFQNGLSLQTGQRYTWRVRVDGETCDEWTEWLYVAGPPTGGPTVG